MIVRTIKNKIKKAIMELIDEGFVEDAIKKSLDGMTVGYSKEKGLHVKKVIKF